MLASAQIKCPLSFNKIYFYNKQNPVHFKCASSGIKHLYFNNNLQILFPQKRFLLLGSIRIGCKLITVHQSLENLSSFESGNKSSVRQSTRGNSLSVYHVKVHCLCFNNAHLYSSFRCRVSDYRWRDYYIGLDWSTPGGQGLRQRSQQLDGNRETSRLQETWPELQEGCILLPRASDLNQGQVSGNMGSRGAPASLVAFGLLALQALYMYCVAGDIEEEFLLIQGRFVLMAISPEIPLTLGFCFLC